MKEYLKKKIQLKIYYYFKNLADENISQEFRPKNTDETRNCLTEETNRN